MFLKITKFTNSLFNGFGQIMLQENKITGMIFLAGIFLESIPMGFAAILAGSVGTITAKYLKFHQENIEKGIYGFSAILVGVALVLLFRGTLIVWVLVIFGAMLASIVQHFFFIRKISVFTFPFVLVTWLLVYFFNQFFPDLNEISSKSFAISTGFTFAFKGFGQVIFQNSVISRILFFIAVFINSPIAALYGLAGSVIAAVLASHWEIHPETINKGLFSYNAVLCAIVFSGTKLMDGVWALTAILLASIVSLLMLQNHLLQLTFPFVLASFIVQFSKYRLTSQKS